MKIPALFKSKHGVTLLELAVVMAIIVVLSGGVVIGFRQGHRRALHNASLQLQADLRYAQRRSIIEGRQFGIAFDVAQNRYRIISTVPTRTVRTVYVQGGATLLETSAPRLLFHPRGTPTAGFRITMAKGTDTQRITASVSGGRIRVFDINELDYE
ncbi:MAG: GspH/FimT family pseudopilin [Defluviitaleaceae bacterium]|nr:GspH/FimT family pseudopilin [Defluviitaleaceae bacterium]MCL2239457.1 GspH/FimT family pseudopilin [Defluviitaleaceae bacterium]